jgi:hypothetical protein
MQPRAHRPVTTFSTASRARQGAPGLTAWTWSTRSGCGNRGGDERPEWPAVGGRGQGRAARRWRCGSFRHALWAEAHQACRAAAPGGPVTGRMRCPPYQPGTAPIRKHQAVSLASCAAVGKSQPRVAERRALSGSAPPASTVLRIPQAGRACGAPLTPEPLPPQRA